MKISLLVIKNACATIGDSEAEKIMWRPHKTIKYIAITDQPKKMYVLAYKLSICISMMHFPMIITQHIQF